MECYQSDGGLLSSVGQDFGLGRIICLYERIIMGIGRIFALVGRFINLTAQIKSPSGLPSYEFALFTA
ncbi:hypothetical protein Q8G35_03515 [Peribacillus simplex]|uniref:Uncharacterized protein n=2 Tax=Peribacillus TaxID=2675229 RepID=A0AA90NYU5_9BACI|nr:MULTISPECIES: hypothetical protein [Peribacillus]MDP1417473.1 hypothetical protein [Peribacillus simplex]MDP1450128.1 hypothetical protein [Peribacillus frigoritolerans]